MSTFTSYARAMFGCVDVRLQGAGLPVGKWIPERKALEILQPPKEEHVPMIPAPLDGPGTYLHIPDPGFRPGPQMFTEARGILLSLCANGLVERRHDPEHPTAPQVRMRTSREIDELKARIIAINQKPNVVTLRMEDADGRGFDCPRHLVDHLARVILEEKRRRENEAFKEQMAAAEDESFMKRRWTAQDRKARAERHRAEIDALVRADS
ncbi:MAG TPA: hypothetical protein VNG12_00090 [Acidimicrobiales bacterium]|nr:hypothetical protein [Acidimicrobiales bacterium]